MLLTDSTLFDGSLLIGGLEHESPRKALTAAIAEHEPAYLRDVMGASACAAFLAGLDPIGGFSMRFSSRFSRGVVADRWKWVRDGHTFTYNGQTYVWPGIKKAIACYVYWQYRRENATMTTSIGETLAKAENATMVSPARKMVAAWNRMVDMNRVLGLMLATLTTGDDLTYPEFNRYEVNGDVYAYQNVFGI